MHNPQNPSEALKQYFGYNSFRPGQEEIIQSVLKQNDGLVLMPTGGGKSITYQVPALLMPGTTIVISPLISLMKDQTEALKMNGIAAEFVNSSISTEAQNDIIRKVEAAEIKLLYVSPERLLTRSFYELMKRINISLIAVDEAHCISEWGHDFRPEYTKLSFIKKYFPDIPVLALTATADKITARDISKQLMLKKPKRYIASFDRPNIKLNVTIGRKRKERIINFINNRPKQSGIVYCLSRKSTESLAKDLINAGIKAAAYHAGMPAEKRNRVQEDFIKDRIPIICATVAFGMGIDKADVRWVVHYNMPKNIENYYQQIGRAGRDGSDAEALMFFSYGDLRTYRFFIDETEDENHKFIESSKLTRMLAYAEARTCRRKILLSYFGEYLNEDCGNCDVCNNPPVSFDGTEITQKALSALARAKENVGLNMLTDILRGASRKEIFIKGYDKIKTYGKGRNLSVAEWQEYIMQMIHLGFLEIAYDKNSALEITEAGKSVLFHNRNVKLVKQEEIQKQKDQQAAQVKPISKTQKLQNRLFEKLRSYRNALAEKENVPPYVIFSNSVLEDLSELRPATIEQLENISGIGKHKMQKYGQAFIDQISEYIKENSADAAKLKGASYIVSHELYKDGLSAEQIAEKRNLNPTTIYSHLAQALESGRKVNISDFLTKEIYESVMLAQKETGEQKLKPIFDKLEGKIDYGLIRMALSYKKYKEKTAH
jgi:ATP-dependent DNA helicase RecQ